LEEAARVLIRSEDSALVKTKIRRLYDIVNVFKSLGLVRRVHLPSKKPAFQWEGEKQLLEIIAERDNTENQVPELK
jgi:transcription factor E2F7/8